MNKKMKILSIILAILFVVTAGCIQNDHPAGTPTPQPTLAPEQTDHPAPAGISIPIPITANYLANNSVTAATMNINATVSSFADNETAGSLTASVWQPLNNNVTIVTNRSNSALVLTYTVTAYAAGNAAYVRLIVNNTQELGSTAVARPYAVPIGGGGGTTLNTTTFVAYNLTVPQGTYRIEPQGNTTGGTFVFQNQSLIVLALPK